ncbi:MAG TPA: AraC family transcriptional regulator [Puia sp.]|nr:AraC family transcriptional regulator [Puia sp.]
MNRKLFSEKFGEIPPAEIIPAPLDGYEVPLEPYDSAIWEGGYYFFQDLDWPVRVRYSNYQLEQDDQLRIVEDEPFMGLQFILGNSFYGDWEGVGRRIDHEASFNFFYVPYVEQTLEGYEADRVYSKIELQYPMELLYSLAPHFPLLEQLLEKAEQGKPSLLHTTNQIAPSEMMGGVRRILYNSMPHGAKALFGEAKGISTLITCLDAFEKQKKSSPPQRLTHYEVEQVYLAKDILTDNMDTPVTLTELSLMVGTNKFRLNSGFKEVYGVTIFDFLLTARMERAQHLLGETDMEIDVVAFLTGYSDVKEFSAVFRKYYGTSPRYYRAQPLFFMLKHRPSKS